METTNFRRSYNSSYINGVECSQIILITNGGFQIFSDTSFYFEKLNSRYTSGQDFELELPKIKRGNKRLFTSEEIPQLKESRIVPKDSVPYEIRKDLYGDGDYLFLVCDDVEVKDQEDEVGQYYTSKTREYHINYNGFKFIGLKHVSNTNSHQARQRIYDNLSGKVTRYENSHRENLTAQINLLNDIERGAYNIKDSIKMGGFHNEEKFKQLTVVVNGKELHTERTNYFRPVEEVDFCKKYDEETIRHFYPVEFKSYVR